MYCYFRISIAGAPPQTTVFQLRPDKCPKTCDNFVALCQSPSTAKRPNATSRTSSSAPSLHPAAYRGTEFHRIIPNFMIQGGDFTKFDGTGGHAAPTTNHGKPTFEDENFDISHNREGILSMANRGPNTNGSQFFITLGRAPHLDRKHVAFGSVVRGMEIFREASKVELEGERPASMQKVVVVDCGLGTGDENSENSTSSSSYTSESSVIKKKERTRSRSKKRSKEVRIAKKKSKRKRSSDDRSNHSKKRKNHDRDVERCDRHEKTRKHKSSDDSRRRHSSFSSDDEVKRSSKKRHKNDRNDDRHHYKKISDKKKR